MSDDGTNGDEDDDPYPTEPVKTWSEGTNRWIEELKGITVRELVDRMKALEVEFGVSPHANPAATNASGNGGNGHRAEQEDPEQFVFDVVITDAGNTRIQVIKAVRAATNLGLKEAKALVDDAPTTVLEGIDRDDATKLRSVLEDAGATVEVK